MISPAIIYVINLIQPILLINMYLFINVIHLKGFEYFNKITQIILFITNYIIFIFMELA